ncbi:MAG: hypothetical protein J6N76_06970, partial [Lachnospiraceae bacterium]|nr:hypothetical protein [Lachnospiraceae bacterium]
MKEINKETIITQLKDSKLKEEEDLQLQKEEELKIQKKRLEDKEKNDAYLNDQQQQLDLQLEEQEPAVNDIDVVQEQENIVGLNRNIEEQKPLEGMANKQEVLQEMEKQEPVLIPKKELKKSIEKKINEVPELPEALSSIVKTISEWTGKLSEESSLPLVNAAKGLLKVTTNREFGFAMADLTKAALDYLNLRKGHRFTLSGRTRQKNAKTLISAIGYFLPEADEQCKKSIENELSSGYASVDYMPDKYKGFYEENNMSFYKKPSEFFDDGGRLDNNALMLNANFYFDMKYGSLQKKEKKLIDSQKTPLVDVKLSKLSAKDYAKQFGPEFKDELNSETRKQEQTEYSELYNKLNNKKLIEESAQKEKPEAEINVDDKRFLKLLDEYMKLDTGKIDLSSDEAVAKSSNRMEILTQKHKQMLELLPVHKKAFDGLTDNSKDYIN